MYKLLLIICLVGCSEPPKETRWTPEERERLEKIADDQEARVKTMLKESYGPGEPDSG